jgi:hypothetical protein
MSKLNGVSEPVALVLEGVTLLAVGIWWPKKKKSKPQHARLDRRSGRALAVSLPNDPLAHDSRPATHERSPAAIRLHSRSNSRTQSLPSFRLIPSAHTAPVSKHDACRRGIP